jgi:G:T/U-mismatch repair DNA glycosylase
MFLHNHPYEPFLFEKATQWIVGTLPPPRFSTGQLKPDDVNFSYGSRDGQLWRILDRLHQLNLKYENSPEAIAERKQFLYRKRIGVCDIVASAVRNRIDASDLGMEEVVLRDLIAYLHDYPSVHTLLFTGGNSKNGPEYFFRRLLKRYGVRLRKCSDGVPRIHEFTLPERNPGLDDSNSAAFRRVIKTVSLVAPSGAANRAVGSMEAYKAMKRKDPEVTTLDFRVQMYRPFFGE